MLAVSLLFGGAQAQTTPGAAGRDLEQRFLAADSNADGALSRQEIEQAGWLKDRPERFNSIDTDRSGTVTLAEIGSALTKQVQEWLAADTDWDGRISAAEAGSLSSLRAVFERVDDGDGYVTSEELQRFGESSYYGAGDLPSVAPNIFEKKF